MKRKSNPKSLHFVAAAIILVLALGIAIAWSFLYEDSKQSKTTGPTPVKGNTTVDEPEASTPTPTVTIKPGTGLAPAKPMLQKSSGNAPGSSIASGVVVEFSCEGMIGNKCDIVLTDRTNSSRVIHLGQKTITSNNRGSAFVLWNWEATKGSWNVVARTTNAAGLSSDSDKQILEVK
jgi:hypothetical protein